MVDGRGPEAAEKLRSDVKFPLAIFIGCRWRLEVARVSQAVCADGPEFRQSEGQAIVLADVAAGLIFRENYAELDAAGDDADLARRNLKYAEFGVKLERTELRNDEELSIGGIEEAVVHGSIGGIEVDGGSDLHGRIAIAAKRNDAINEIRLLLGERQWVPAQLIGSCRRLQKWPAADQPRSNLFIRTMGYRWTNAISPGAAIGGTRRRKWSAAELLGIQTKRMFLRCILSSRQRT